MLFLLFLYLGCRVSRLPRKKMKRRQIPAIIWSCNQTGQEVDHSMRVPINFSRSISKPKSERGENMDFSNILKTFEQFNFSYPHWCSTKIISVSNANFFSNTNAARHDLQIQVCLRKNRCCIFCALVMLVEIWFFNGFMQKNFVQVFCTSLNGNTYGTKYGLSGDRSGWTSKTSLVFFCIYLSEDNRNE